MPEPQDTPSRITAFMVTVKELLEANVDKIGNVVLLGQRNVESLVQLMSQKGGGQAVSIMAIGGSNANPNVKGPQMTTNFQLSVYDDPNMRDHYARHGYELVEDSMRLLHRQNLQGLDAQCTDLAVADWFLEQDEGADIYTISLEASLKYTPLPIT